MKIDTQALDEMVRKISAVIPDGKIIVATLALEALKAVAPITKVSNTEPDGPLSISPSAPDLISIVPLFNRALAASLAALHSVIDA